MDYQNEYNQAKALSNTGDTRYDEEMKLFSSYIAENFTVDTSGICTKCNMPVSIDCEICNGSTFKS